MDKMARRCQATYSSTPASLIYAQSWPVPSGNSLGKIYTEKPTSHRKSLNSPWISKAKKQSKTCQKSPSQVEKTNSWAKSMLSNHYPEWIEEDAHMKLDMAKEFRLTLQTFKKLTQQVQEVDEQLNSCRKSYSFKHYFNDKETPKLYRSQLAAARTRFSYVPEIPLTNQAHEPCNNFGVKREQLRPHSHLGVSRKTDESINSITKPKDEGLSSSNRTFKKNSKAVQDKQKEPLINQVSQVTIKEEVDSEEFAQVSSPDSNEGDVGFGYMDPVPSDWDERKLEELEQEFCLEDKGKADTFIIRYLQLRRLEAETIEVEKLCSSKSEENVENATSSSASTRVASVYKNQSTLRSSSSEKCSVRSTDEKNMKNPVKSLRKCGHSSKSDLDVDKHGKSCMSKYCEVGRLERERAINKEKKQTNQYSSKRNKCLSARARRDCSSNGNGVNSTGPVTSYDIVELASTFEPPSKDRLMSKSRPVTAKSAKSKGLLPGKSCHSQRRFSLTAHQTLLPLASNTDASLNKSSVSKGRHKSAKRKTRRCVSSNL